MRARMAEERKTRLEQIQAASLVALHGETVRSSGAPLRRCSVSQAVFAGLGAGTRTLLEEHWDSYKGFGICGLWMFVDVSHILQDRSKMTVLVGGLTALALGVLEPRFALHHSLLT